MTVATVYVVPPHFFVFLVFYLVLLVCCVIISTRRGLPCYLHYLVYIYNKTVPDIVFSSLAFVYVYNITSIWL